MRKIFDDLIGIPFRPWGREPAAGLDCWGLVMEVYSRLGITLPDLGVDPLNACEVGAQGEKSKSRFVRLDGPEVPCIVLLKNHPRFFNHTGVVVEPGWFMHCLRQTGVIKERLDHPKWKRRIEGFYQWQI